MTAPAEQLGTDLTRNVASAVAAANLAAERLSERQRLLHRGMK
jgi:hypothetical protein